MKNILLTIFLILVLNASAQEKTINLIDKTLSNLKIERTNCLADFLIVKSISDNESIVIIPEITHQEDGILMLNGHLLIVDNKNGKIKSQFSEENSWISDALRIENIEVIYQPYEISKNTQTIGILITYYGSSSANPYSGKELSMFIRNGENIE